MHGEENYLGKGVQGLVARGRGNTKERFIYYT